jgi:ATP-dependent Clp protease ATP-binding subunit ClpC
MQAKLETETRRVLDTTTVSEMEQEFRAFAVSRLFDQPEAIEAMCRAFRRSVNPFRDAGKRKKKPVYCVVNAGESRTGKTLFAELLAEFLHGDPEALLLIDGSEYQERHQLIGLVGATRSYVGYENPKDKNYTPPAPDEKDPYAELSQHNLEWSRRGSQCPISIILVDEWEKACWEFNRIFLGIMDRAKRTLANGQVVDFSNTIIIFTTNTGMGEVEEEKSKNPMGFGSSKKVLTQKDVLDIVLKHMKRFAPPEFRNRLKENGEIVVFRSLTEAGKYKILDRDIQEVQGVFASNPERMFTVSVDDRARRFMMTEALRDDGNVSNLKSAVKTLLEEPLTGEAIKRTIGLGDWIEVTHENGKDGLTFYCTKDGAMLVRGGSPTPTEASASATETGASRTNDAGEAPAASVPALVSPRGRYVVVPGVPVLGGGVLIDMSELMFLMKASDLKAQAQRECKLLAPYIIRLTHKDSLDALTISCLSMVREITEILGVEVLNSQTSYQAPYSVAIKVMAIPGQIELITLRYPGISVTLDTTDPDKQ